MFDRIVTFGSGFAGVALLAATVLHFRAPAEPLATPSASVTAVVAAASPLVTQSGVPSAAPSPPASPGAPLPVGRIHIVPWPTEAPARSAPAREHRLAPRAQGVSHGIALLERPSPGALAATPHASAAFRERRPAVASRERPDFAAPRRLIAATLAPALATHRMPAAALRSPKDVALRAPLPSVAVASAGHLRPSATHKRHGRAGRRGHSRRPLDAPPEPPVGYDPNPSMLAGGADVPPAATIAEDAAATAAPVYAPPHRGR